MKKILLLLATVLCGFIAAQAQTVPTTYDEARLMLMGTWKSVDYEDSSFDALYFVIDDYKIDYVAHVKADAMGYYADYVNKYFLLHEDFANNIRPYSDNPTRGNLFPNITPSYRELTSESFNASYTTVEVKFVKVDEEFEITKGAIVFKPWNDLELTYLGDGDIVGMGDWLVKNGSISNIYDRLLINVINTNLVNEEDPTDELPLALSGNLSYVNSIEVNGTDVDYSEATDAVNQKLFSTLAVEQQYVYIDKAGSAEDFAAVSDVLAGKIAVCNRGDISFYVKANAAMANGAIGLIVVNNQDGAFKMNLTGYEYNNPAVSITKADGELLKNNATFVDGDAPNYLGTLTVYDADHKHLSERSMISYQMGYDEVLEPRTVYESAEVLDWSAATPGATYKATINYDVTHYVFNTATGYWQIKETIPANPTTLTLKVTDATGIEDVTIARPTDNRRYNIMGQPVGEDYKGIVIMNGQKMIVR